MIGRKLMRRIAIAAVTLLVLGGAVAYATIPDSSGVIHGCRKNSGGNVRVIDSGAGQTCPTGWTPLNWSQTGPQGPAGASGGVSGYEVVRQRLAWPSEPEVPVTLSATCPAGKVAIGAGFKYLDGMSALPSITASEPSSVDPAAWLFRMPNSDFVVELDVSVICVNAGS